MEVKEMKSASLEALKHTLDEAESELRNLRNSISSHQLSQVHKVQIVRKNIARLNTFLNCKIKQS